MSDFKQVMPLDDFDWESYEGGSINGGQTEEEQEKAYGDALNQIT